MDQSSHTIVGLLFGDGTGKQGPGRYIGLFALLAVAAFATGVITVFHDRFWWPPDDGAYGHVAERLLAGAAPSENRRNFGRFAGSEIRL